MEIVAVLGDQERHKLEADNRQLAERLNKIAEERGEGR